jgi:hypothetical protein
MPGFCQFVTGSYILIGLSWFHSFEGAPLYAAGVLTTLFGIHWFALGLIRMHQGDPRPSGFMSIAFFLVSILGITVFARAGDWPVCLLFIGLMSVYVTEFFASFNLLMPVSQRLLVPDSDRMLADVSDLRNRAQSEQRHAPSSVTENFRFAWGARCATCAARARWKRWPEAAATKISPRKWRTRFSARTSCARPMGRSRSSQS